MNKSSRLLIAVVVALALLGCSKPAAPPSTEKTAPPDSAPTQPSAVSTPSPAPAASNLTLDPRLQVLGTKELVKQYYAALLAHDYAKALTYWSPKSGQTAENLKIPDGVSDIYVLKVVQTYLDPLEEERDLVYLLVTADQNTKGEYFNGKITRGFYFQMKPEFKIKKIQ